MLLRSVRSRLLGLIVATFIPFTALIGAGLWNQWQHDKERAIEATISQARSLAAQVDDRIGELQLLLTGIGPSVSPNASDAAANNALLRRVKAELPAYIGNISLFSLGGVNIGSSAGPDFPHPLVNDRSYFQKVLSGQRLSIGDVIRSRPTGKWVVNLARPVEDQTGRLTAVMVVGITLEHFQDALRIPGSPSAPIVNVTSDKGIVIARNEDPASWVGKDVNRWRTYRYNESMLEGNVITEWSNRGNREYITGFATAHRVPWRAQVSLPKSVALAPVTARLQSSALFIVASFILACAIAWLLSGRIAQPLRQLGKDAAILAAGDLSHRTTVQTSDECGTLANSFNNMALSLEKREGELRKTKNTLSAIIDASPVAIACSGPDDRTILWNRAAEQIFGYSASEMLGQRRVLSPGEGESEAKAIFAQAASGETVRDITTTRRRKDGSFVDVRIAAAPVYDSDGTVRGVARVYEDITERRRAEEQLRRIAHYDPLTHLPNRLSLQKRLGELLAKGEQSSPVALVLFDLDGFKEVNDSLGHATGDELLVEVGRRLISATKENAGEVEKVYRLGGDEFVVIMPSCGDPLEIVQMVDRALEALAQPFQVNDHVLHVAASAGVAIGPHDGTSVDVLTSNADLALYQAKSTGGRAWRLFSPTFYAHAQAQRGLGLELRRAFDENEFELYFQPQIRMTDRAIVGAEALLRWRHPVRGVIAPGAFIDSLAKNVVAFDVGRWIIRTACQRAATWRRSGLPVNRIAVNLFPAQAQHQALLGDVESALRDFDLPPDVLELEITENAAFNFGEPSQSLQKLHEIGVKLAFDDFGTGYASLRYLTRFPVSRIKLDRSFVAKIPDGSSDATIIKSLIAMAHSLGLKVIAEGVETDAQAAFLLKEGCEEAQGFLYAKPLPDAAFEQYLRNGSSPAADELPRQASGGV